MCIRDSGMPITATSRTAGCQAIDSHPAVLEVAVIGIPDETWGERPKAFVVLRPGAELDGAELIEHVRARIARYKAPAAVDFVEALPKTSTGKMQKFALREKEWAGHVSRIPVSYTHLRAHETVLDLV